MPRAPFEEIWKRIVAHAGAPFETKRRLPFTFRVQGDAVVPSRTDYVLHRSDFETAHGMTPCQGPAALGDRVRGPSYIWAILHDPRVRRGEP